MLFLGVGCASHGTNFNESHVSAIKRGVTTEPQLIAWFGEPQERSTGTGGAYSHPMIVPGVGPVATGATVAPAPNDIAIRTILTWYYGEARVSGKSFIPVVGGFLGGSDSSHKSLTVVLKEGLVDTYTSSSGGSGTRGTTESTPGN